MRLVVAVEKELAQLNQREVDTEVAGDDDNEIREGADGEMNEKTQECKSTTLLHESRRGSDHAQNTSIWSDH